MPHPTLCTAAVAAGLLFTLAPPGRGQAPDPVDHLAKPAPAVVVPKLLLGLMGFDTPESVDQKYPLPQDRKVIYKVRKDRYERESDSLLPVFEKHGNTKASWAPQVRAAMTAYCGRAARTAMANQGVYYQAFIKALTAVPAACDDPVIGYWRVRYLPEMTTFKTLPAYTAAVEKLIDAKAYPILALYAGYNHWYTARALSRLPDSTLTPTELAAADALLDRAERAAVPAAVGPAMSNLYDVSAMLVDQKVAWGEDRLTAWKAVDRKLAERKAPAWVRDALEGKVFINAAWDARGNGVAGAVSDDAFETFHERLTKAKAKLTAAWQADPSRPEPPTQMLYVAKGLGFPREEMETWFRRAMEADPDNLEACRAKKDWLQPKWHGTNEDVTSFIVQCLRTNNYYGRLPSVVEVPRAFDLPYDQPEALAKYTSQPATWTPIELVAEAHLARYPDDVWARTRYAYHASLWKRWDVAVKQFDAVGATPGPGSYYDTLDEYTRDMTTARKRAGGE